MAVVIILIIHNFHEIVRGLLSLGYNYFASDIINQRYQYVCLIGRFLKITKSDY